MWKHCSLVAGCRHFAGNIISMYCGKCSFWSLHAFDLFICIQSNLLSSRGPHEMTWRATFVPRALSLTRLIFMPLVITVDREACIIVCILSRMVLEGAPLIAIHKARYYKRADGLALGPGPFVAGLEFAADCRATVVGKPEKCFFTQVRSLSNFLTHV